MNHVEAAQQSEANSRKLDRIMSILEGDGADMPGLVRLVAELREAMFGVRGRNGLTQKVDIMWRIYIWLLCTLSGAAGFLIKAAFDAIQKGP